MNTAAKFKVISSNKGEKNGNFVTKLQRETIVTDAIFGDKKKSETYYISGSKEVTVGSEIAEAQLFPKFAVKEHPMVNPETGAEFMGKWLHLA